MSVCGLSIQSVYVLRVQVCVDLGYSVCMD